MSVQPHTPQGEAAADKRPRSPGPSSPRGEPRKKRVRSDLSFALDNPVFADCKLIICGETEGSAESSPLHLKEVAVNSAVLAANSAYFERMLAGHFLEGATRHIKIHVAEEDLSPFLHMLDFMYSGNLPQQVSSSFDDSLKVLLLADKFEADDCLAACASALDKFLPELTTSQAISLLSLPDHIKQEPQMLTAVEKGRICIVKEYEPLMESSETSGFCSLPEPGFIALLSSQDLKCGADTTMCAAADWIDENYKDSDKANLSAFCRLALPSLRASSLYPSNVNYLFGRIRPALTDSPGGGSAVMSQGDDQEAPSPLEERDENASSAGGPSPHEGDKCSSKEAVNQEILHRGREEVPPVRDVVLTWLLDSLLDFSEQLQVERGYIEWGTKLESLLRDGAPAKAPKVHHLPPKVKIHLDIPRRLLKDANWTGTIKTQPAIIDGNWVRLSAQRLNQHDRLSIALTWCTDGLLESELSSTEFELSMILSLETWESSPAYALVSQDTHRFKKSSPKKSLSFSVKISSIVEDQLFYCPQGALRLRVDLWTVKRE